MVTARDYTAVGGVVGGLRTRAGAQLALLTADGYGPAVLPTLLQLADLDGRGNPVRRPLQRDTLRPEQRAVVDAFVDARLLVTRGPAPGDDEGHKVTATVRPARPWRCRTRRSCASGLPCARQSTAREPPCGSSPT